MKTAQVIETNAGQAVQIPDEFRFKADTVSIRRDGAARGIGVELQLAIVNV